MDSINVARSTCAYALIEDLSDKGLFPQWTSVWITPEWLALLIILAKKYPDDSDVFARGKWASIQFLEDLLDQAIPPLEDV